MKTYLTQPLKSLLLWFKRNRWQGLIAAIAALILGLSSITPVAANPPTTVTFFDNPDLQIANGVVVPRDASYFFTSGLTPRRLADGTFPVGTYDQAVDVLSRIEELLAEEGLSMSDVVYTNAYLTADPALGAVDYDGWFQAYDQFFNNNDNPVKTARTTLEVTSLVRSDWRIEVAMTAVYPQ